MARPSVSVIVPFHGDAAAARALLAAVRAVELQPGDEVLIADNTLDEVCARQAPEAFATVVKRSPYGARNEAAERARGAWLLFTDSDCRPRTDVLDAYFAGPPLGERCGAVAGEVVAASGGHGLVARYAAARGHLSQAAHLRHAYRPMAVTANLLVRAQALRAVGGFAEGVRSGGDADLCWRLQAAGWTLEHRPSAVVEHEHRETLWGLLRQIARYSAGAAWLERRHPGSSAAARPAIVRDLARALAGTVVFPLRGEPERGAFKALDAAFVVAQAAGFAAGNRYPRPPGTEPAGLTVANVWPHPGDEPASPGERVEAARRPLIADWPASRTAEAVYYGEDDGAARRALDALVLLARGHRVPPADAPAIRRARRTGLRPRALAGAERRAARF